MDGINGIGVFDVLRQFVFAAALITAVFFLGAQMGRLARRPAPAKAPARKR